MANKSYDEFFDELGKRESSGNYEAENNLGYIGKYQMGEAALVDTGYYDPTSDGNLYKNDWSGKWTGKNGVWNKDDFLKNHQAQEEAVRMLAQRNWQTIERLNLDRYVGQEINGIEVTVSGLLAGAHLKGVGRGGVIDFVQEGLSGKDAYGTSISEYIDKFGNYETPFESVVKEPDPNQINNHLLNLSINTDLNSNFRPTSNPDQVGNAIDGGDYSKHVFA